jgi:eukaryotic-like serine/threonine-protein kinase
MDRVNEGIRVLGNRYEIGELLGRGGMAEVHLGRDARLGRVVAIKLLRTDLARDPMFQARFRREAQSAAGLNHPAIVAVYDTGEETITDATGNTVSLPYIVMEHVDGRTLRDMLSDGQTLDVDLALEVTSGVLSALEYSHRSGIVHRDIKPANVMMTPSGDIKVMDFGIARALADASSAMTQTQAVIGTAQYLSPEQARGESVDVRSDLYSTGCLLFELLTGRPPFVADSPVAVAYQHVREMPQPPSTFNPAVPEEVDRIVLHALSKERDDRYQTAGEFRNDVEAARAGRRVNAPMAPMMAAGPPTAATEYFPPAAAAPPTRAGDALLGPQPAAYDTYAPPGGYPTGPYAENGMPRRDRQPPKKNRGLNYTLLALAVVAVLALLGWFVYTQLNSGGTKTPTTATATVPAVKGQQQDIAEQAIKTAGLVSTVTRKASNDDPGTVIDSNPAEGAVVDQGSTVTLTVSAGPDTVPVPDVVGQTQSDASNAITSKGLQLGAISNENNPAFKAGEVIRTDPKAGTAVAPGSKVKLVVASGDVVVPDVRGLTTAAAKKKLGDLGLNVAIDKVPSTEPEGTVLDQDHVGDTVKVGTQINITVATPAPTTSTTTTTSTTSTTTSPTTTTTTPP